MFLQNQGPLNFRTLRFALEVEHEISKWREIVWDHPPPNPGQPLIPLKKTLTTLNTQEYTDYSDYTDYTDYTGIHWQHWLHWIHWLHRNTLTNQIETFTVPRLLVNALLWQNLDNIRKKNKEKCFIIFFFNEKTLFTFLVHNKWFLKNRNNFSSSVLVDG